MRSFILSVLVFPMASGFSFAQNVAIPDTAFLYALIDEGVDTNGDSLISFAEAEAVTALDVHNNITDMTGIEAFTNLDTLNCNGEGSSEVTPNFITSLDVSNNSNLEDLRCWNNDIASLIVSNDTVLSDLNCHGNLLTSLDLSKTTSLKTLNIADMPTLYEVCVWTMPFPPEGVEVYASNSPNICFTDSCGSCGVGVNEYNADEFRLYPNPARNWLTIEINTTVLHSLQITSLNGQLLYSDRMTLPLHFSILSSSMNQKLQ